MSREMSNQLFNEMPPLILMNKYGGTSACASVTTNRSRVSIGNADLINVALLTPHNAAALVSWLQRALEPGHD